MSTGHLRIELLGRLRVVQAEGVVERFTTQKNAALLGALALEPGRKNLRDTLITQLWPDADEIPGRNRLNQAVSTLRKVLGEALCSDSGSLWLDAELVSTDVNEFRNEEDFATDLRSDTQANSLIKLVELYRGPLLEGVNEPWLNRERSLLEETYGTYLRTLVRFGVKSGDTAKILLFAQRLAVHDPLDVEAHSALMKLHLAQQRPQAVLRQYDELLKSLPPDFVPAREIDALVENAHAMLTTGNLAGERTFVPKLPRFIDSFFGREAEIAELDALVSAGCRLITLHGTGGVGKTRLAVKFAASQIDRFKGRVAFVSGVGATNLDELKRAVIKVLSSAGNSDPANFGEVVHRLDGAQPFLVVLDSVEHLIEPLFKLQELLVKATGLYILVTSRRPLGLATEQVLAVTPLEGGADSPAVQLFCRRYSRLRENFEFREEDYVAVRQICENLQGLPIAIEMAAGWARLLSPEQIRVRLSKALGLTFESGRETSQLSALLGRSIELLGKERREKFRILCCFEADFALEAAEFVLGEQALLLLRDFEDHALINIEIDVNGDQRFRIFRAVREAALSDATPDERQTAMEPVLAYCLALTKRTEALANSMFYYGALREIDADRATLQYVFDYLISQSRWREATKLAQNMGLYWRHVSDWNQGVSSLQLLLDRAGEVGLNPSEIGYLHLNLAGVLRMLGQAEEFHDHYKLAHQAFETTQDFGALLRAKFGIAAYYQGLEEFETQEQILNEALVLSQETGSHSFVAFAYMRLGHIATDKRKYEEAKSLYQLGLTQARISGYDSFEAGCLQGLGHVAFITGNFDASIELYRLVLEIFEKNRELYAIWDTRLELARALIANNELESAGEILLMALDTVQQYRPLQEPFLYAAAHHAQKTGNHKLAAQIIGFAEQNNPSQRAIGKLQLALGEAKQGAQGALGNQFSEQATVGRAWKLSDLLQACRQALMPRVHRSELNNRAV